MTSNRISMAIVIGTLVVTSCGRAIQVADTEQASREAGSSATTAQAPPDDSLRPVLSKPVNSTQDLIPYDPDTDRVLWTIRQMDIGKCVRATGVEYVAIAYPGPDSAPAPEGPVEPTVEDAAKYGFYAAGGESVASVVVSFDPRLAETMEGSAGCRAAYDDVARRLSLTAETAYQTLIADLSPLLHETFTAWQTGPGVAGYAKFGACMTDRGYPNFNAPAQFPPREGPPSEKEIQAAVAAATCMQEIQLYQSLRDMKHEALDRWVSDNSEAVESLRATIATEAIRIRAYGESIGVV